MDNVLIVVADLEAAKAFFAELGMEPEGETTVEGPWVDSVVGLEDVRADIATMRTPDGHGRVELTKFHTPPAVRAEPEGAPANALGIRRIMFEVDDVHDVVARLRSLGAELVGEIAQYDDVYRLCFLRGPEGIIIGSPLELWVKSGRWPRLDRCFERGRLGGSSARSACMLTGLLSGGLVSARLTRPAELRYEPSPMLRTFGGGAPPSSAAGCWLSEDRGSARRTTCVPRRHCAPRGATNRMEMKGLRRRAVAAAGRKLGAA